MNQKNTFLAISPTQLGWLSFRLVIGLLGVGAGYLISLIATGALVLQVISTAASTFPPFVPARLVPWMLPIALYTFAFGAAYPLLSAFLKSRMPSFGTEPWDRVSLTSNPFRSRGPHHFTQLLTTCLVGVFIGMVIGFSVASRAVAAPPASIIGFYLLTMTSLIMGLTVGVIASNGIFDRGYVPANNVEISDKNQRGIERFVSVPWIIPLFLPVLIMLTGMVVYALSSFG